MGTFAASLGRLELPVPEVLQRLQSVLKILSEIAIQITAKGHWKPKNHSLGVGRVRQTSPDPGVDLPGPVSHSPFAVVPTIHPFDIPISTLLDAHSTFFFTASKAVVLDIRQGQ